LNTAGTDRVTVESAFTPSSFDRRGFLGLPWTRMPKCVLGQFSSAYDRWHGIRAAAVVLTLGTLALPAFAGLSQKEERRHEIDRAEDTWRSAVLASNTKALDILLADDYIGITPSGAIQNKEDMLQSLRSGRVHFDLLNISDRKVRFYGSTAVVTSLVEIQARTADGPIAGGYRYTRVYVRNAQGQWKIVSFEASQIQEPGPHRKNETH